MIWRVAVRCGHFDRAGSTEKDSLRKYGPQNNNNRFHTSGRYCSKSLTMFNLPAAAANVNADIPLAAGKLTSASNMRSSSASSIHPERWRIRKCCKHLHELRRYHYCVQLLTTGCMLTLNGLNIVVYINQLVLKTKLLYNQLTGMSGDSQWRCTAEYLGVDVRVCAGSQQQLADL